MPYKPLTKEQFSKISKKYSYDEIIAFEKKRKADSKPEGVVKSILKTGSDVVKGAADIVKEGTEGDFSKIAEGYKKFQVMQLEGRRHESKACASCYQMRSQIDNVDPYREQILENIK